METTLNLNKINIPKSLKKFSEKNKTENLLNESTSDFKNVF